MCTNRRNGPVDRGRLVQLAPDVPEGGQVDDHVVGPFQIVRLMALSNNSHWSLRNGSGPEMTPSFSARPLTRPRSSRIHCQISATTTAEATTGV